MASNLPLSSIVWISAFSSIIFVGHEIGRLVVIRPAFSFRRFNLSSRERQIHGMHDADPLSITGRTQAA
ncbi:unnamed protein product [Dibothriocephalus latus]|uniref:Uncharacterized protein n=1 Tax=Dibothriocephalus latus TaxID=60516 RepID=A0A3P6R3Q6_DIBLA|nr:unnamed protein product [Dibothriocephalus latus]